MLSSGRLSKSVSTVLNNSLKSSSKRCFTGSISPSEFTMKEFDHTVNILRTFFRNKGWREVHMQHRKSIMAACEDPWTIASFEFDKKKWPLPQTSQMWLEHELLNNPDVPGIYTLSTSYRQEPYPMPGRHETMFPMFEFEGKGNYEDLNFMLKNLLNELGLKGSSFEPKEITYDEACWKLNRDEIEARDEAILGEEMGSDVYFIKKFPERTSPFWNMKREKAFTFRVDSDNHRKTASELLALKTDVIVAGHETIGCAERETDKHLMRDNFETISGGRYADKIRSEFGRERVNRELENFLEMDFFERYGGGIGVHRLINGMRKLGVFDEMKLYSDPDFNTHVILSTASG